MIDERTTSLKMQNAKSLFGKYDIPAFQCLSGARYSGLSTGIGGRSSLVADEDRLIFLKLFGCFCTPFDGAAPCSL